MAGKGYMRLHDRTGQSLQPRNPCKHMDFYSFTDPGGVEG